MAADKVNHNELTGPTCMHSVNRITKFPAVESTIQTATNLYEKVKDYNGLTQWTLNSAETTVHSIVEKGKPYANPVLSNLEGPIKTVDGILCSGLDYVETKVPAVKLPPSEILLQIYNSTKEYVTPAMETAYAYAEQAKGMVEPRIQQARDLVDPAYQAALHTVEPMVAAVQPTVEAARNMVEPIVQPTLEKAQQLKDYGKQKVNEYLHRGHSNEADNLECQECQECQDKPLIQQAHDLLDPIIEASKPTVEALISMVEPFVQPTLARAQQLKDCSIQQAHDLVDSTVEAAPQAVYPNIVVSQTLESAENITEPIVQPTVEEAKQLKDNEDQKANKCQQSQDVKEKMSESVLE